MSSFSPGSVGEEGTRSCTPGPSGFTLWCQSPSSLARAAHSKAFDWPPKLVPSFLSLPGRSVLDPGLVRLCPGSGPLLLSPSPSHRLTHILGSSPPPPPWGPLSLGMFASQGRRGRVWKPLALWSSLSWGESWLLSSPSFIWKLLISSASPASFLCLKRSLYCDFL